MEKHVVLILLGLIFVILGCINIGGNVSTVHWYNRRKVRQSDIPKYGKWIGTGTLLIGASMVISQLLEVIIRSVSFDFVILLGCMLGIILILYAQFKYNKGII